MNTEEIHLLNGVLLGDRMAADEFVHRYSRFIYLVIHEGPLPPLKPLPSGGLGSVEIGTNVFLHHQPFPCDSEVPSQ